MNDQPTDVLGIFIPSSDPIFLKIVSFHILLGLICVISGAMAMLSKKGKGRHSKSGSVYFWGLSVLVLSASILAFMRWEHSAHLFFLGLFSFLSALVARISIRNHWGERIKPHIVGFGVSYILLLVSFYVDNGPHLPVWRNLPPITYWVLPMVCGIPLIMRALFKYKKWR